MIEYTEALAALTTEPAGIDFPSQTIVWPESNTGTAPTWSELMEKVQQLKLAEPLRQLRIQRNNLLAQTDWRMTTDYPYADQSQWATYRTELRNLPESAEPALDEQGNLTNVVWPTPPSDL